MTKLGSTALLATLARGDASAYEVFQTQTTPPSPIEDDFDPNLLGAAEFFGVRMETPGTVVSSDRQVDALQGGGDIPVASGDLVQGDRNVATTSTSPPLQPLHQR